MSHPAPKVAVNHPASHPSNAQRRPHKREPHVTLITHPMNLLPHTSGSRPRLACEIFPGGVIAGRSPEPGLPLSAIAKAELAVNAVVPSLKPGNIPDRVAVVAAVRRTLEAVGVRPNARNSDLTLVIPDAAVRVLLLDFDALPGKLSEALPIVRFRLKKLVPFDSDDAMVSFQVMSTSRAMIRVLAVTIPRNVLSEYESVVREAGFEPGAVLPSTLAAMAALEEGEGASLLVNAHSHGVTTAIVRAGIVLLHRSVELAEFAAPTPANLPSTLFEDSATHASLLPLVDPDATEAEWAAQQPLPEYGRNPYADRLAAEAVTQDQDSITGLGTPPLVLNGGRASEPRAYSSKGSENIDMYASEAAPVHRSPYASPMLQEELDTQFHNAPYLPPTVAEGVSPVPGASGEFDQRPGHRAESEPLVHTLAPDVLSAEIANAVSVAMAFFEDNLAVVPEILLSAGPLGAEALNQTLREQGIAQEDGVRVRELVDNAALAPSAVTAQVPRGWLAGITGALKS